MNEAGGHTLSFAGVSVDYAGRRAVEDFSLDVGAGEIVGLVGESGAGKTTVLKSAAGLLGPGGKVAAGSIRLGGVEVVGADAREMARLRGRVAAYVFQDPKASLDALFTVRDQFDECMRAALGPAPSRAQRRAEQRRLLADMGLEQPDRVLASRPHELSGGMCQRVVLAFAVACRPAVLLADEPTSALDTVAQAGIVGVLRHVRDAYGVSILVATHNLGVAANLADRIAVMRGGRLVEAGPAREVIERPAHPYTRELIAAVPQLPDGRTADGSQPGEPQPGGRADDPHPAGRADGLAGGGR